MKFNKDLLDKKWVAYTIATCSAVLLYLFLTNLKVFAGGLAVFADIVSPVFGGLIVAYVMEPLVSFLQKKLFKKMKSEKIGRAFSVFLAVVTVLLAGVLLSIVLIPQLADSVVTLVNNLGNYQESLQVLLNQLVSNASVYHIDISEMTQIWENLLQKLLAAISDNMDNIISTSFGIGEGFVNAVIAFILAIYFMLDKNKLKNGCKKLLFLICSEKRYRGITDFSRRCNKILLRYIACDLVDGLLVGIVNFIFMSICRMPYAMLLSIVVGVTNLAPTFGPVLGAVIGAFILVLVNPWYALWFLVFTIILQTLDGYVLKPKLFGGTFGISSLWILITIVVGGRMFGIIGIMLAIPFAAIIDIVFREVILRKMEVRRRKRECGEKTGAETKTERAEQAQ